ncbi:MAG: iron ABC transporter permease [Brachymonas sp.]|nr:iron ABC transporter permease [Brachymonas sp.]
MRVEDIYRAHESRLRRRWLFLLGSLLLLAASALLSISLGASELDFAQTLRAVWAQGGRSHDIVWALRLPRAAIAMAVGFGLGISGVVFQAVLRNPLASPSTLGVASAAGFGAVSVILLTGVESSNLAVATGAFVAALLSASFIFAIARIKGATSETLILTGVAQMFLFSALTSLAQYMGTVDQLVNIVFWSFGSLSKAGWVEIGLACAMVLLPAPVLLWRAWDFNLLAMGDDTAKSSGVQVENLRLLGIALASLSTTGAICFTGVIGFVGLVAPHITRMLIGNDHQYLLPVSGIVGALLVVLADALGRSVLAPQIVPIGIVTSLLGVPFFFYLLMRRARESW